MTTASEGKTSPESRKQRFFGFVFLAIVAGALTVGSIFALSALQLRLCPASTFLTGSMHPSLQEAAVVIFALCLAFLIEHWAAFRFPKFGRLINLPFRKRRRQPFTLYHLWSNILIVVLCLALLLLWVAIFSNFCLTPTNIETRIWPWDTSQSRGWENVVYVQTACWRGSRGSWPAAYVLGFKDEYRLDIASGLNRKTDPYPELSKALQGVPFVFDSRAVSPNCGNAGVKLLRTRP